MGMIREILGSKSKYDKSLPYTYMARQPAIEGDAQLYNYYFADTICGLIEYLDQNEISPSEVDLFGLYKETEISLNSACCISEKGKWLKRPEICKSLEDQYNRTKEEKYKGHRPIESCSFEDRDRKGSGPF
jgi:hypothetical protein